MEPILDGAVMGNGQCRGMADVEELRGNLGLGTFDCMKQNI
ncbi:hypothetical protein [Heliomicrobium gestii]|nr:hypothetical protein [Heliomicrobium gestii]MBM7866929.1 hypothetical protein [Heliomicrobium gestii]